MELAAKTLEQRYRHARAGAVKFRMFAKTCSDSSKPYIALSASLRFIFEIRMLPAKLNKLHFTSSLDNS
jgi:hypothetical protein